MIIKKLKPQKTGSGYQMIKDHDQAGSVIITKSEVTIGDLAFDKYIFEGNRHHFLLM